MEFLPQSRASLFLRINVEVIFSENFYGFDEKWSGIIYVFSKDFKVFAKNVCRLIIIRHTNDILKYCQARLFKKLIDGVTLRTCARIPKAVYDDG